MSITLQMQHTFNTRIVYSTEEIAAVRELMQETMGALYQVADSENRKQASLARAGIEFSERALRMGDEDLIIFLAREAFKTGFRDCIREELKALNVTKLSPVQSLVVGRG